MILLLGALSLTTAARADLWYEHYAAAERALAEEDWSRAVEELNAAVEKRGDSAARARTYGMKVTSYFPYLKLGIAYFRLGQLEAALQAFETEEQLGAIAGSAPATGELERFRGLVETERQAEESAERARISEVVRRQLAEAAELESSGDFDAAVAALDLALAVAPDDPEAVRAMTRLRGSIAEREGAAAREARSRQLVAEGRDHLDAGRFQEAARRLREAIALVPDAAAESLLAQALTELRRELPADGAAEASGGAPDRGVELVLDLESAGRIVDALEELQRWIAGSPGDDELRAIEARLLRRRHDETEAATRRATIERLLGEAASDLEAGSVESALSAANRVLALEPGNPIALDHVAAAYRAISRRVLGAGSRQNVPPAVRFMDLRQEADDGRRVQAVRDAEFALAGLVIDDSPVEIDFYLGDEELSPPNLHAQSVGDYYVTEFQLGARVPTGHSTLRIVATDAAGASASSEYEVLYTQPLFRQRWFIAMLAFVGLASAGALWWRRSSRLDALRRRRFNPYVAGAPVLDSGMFFGRGDVVDRVLQAIHNNSLLLYGERRIGKTSIQHRLKARLLEIEDPDYDFFPVYVDLQGTPEERFFATMCEDIFSELEPALGGLEPCRDPVHDYSYRDFVRDVHAVLKRLKRRTEKTVKLVLLIDEVDELNDYDPRINQKLRSLFMKSFAENLVSVVSGVEIKKRWEREGSPWYNFFEEIEIKPLSAEAARELVERPIRGVFTVDEGVADRIATLAERKPYRIQRLCMSLVSKLYEEGRRRITLADVAALASSDEV